jgi:hypothetical protein
LTFCFPLFSVAFPIGINILLCASSTISSEIHLISIPPSQFCIFFSSSLSLLYRGRPAATSRWAIVCTNRIDRSSVHLPHGCCCCCCWPSLDEICLLGLFGDLWRRNGAMF